MPPSGVKYRPSLAKVYVLRREYFAWNTFDRYG